MTPKRQPGIGATRLFMAFPDQALSDFDPAAPQEDALAG